MIFYMISWLTSGHMLVALLVVLVYLCLFYKFYNVGSAAQLGMLLFITIFFYPAGSAMWHFTISIYLDCSKLLMHRPRIVLKAI